MKVPFSVKLAEEGYPCLNALGTPWGRYIAYCQETDQVWILNLHERPAVSDTPSHRNLPPWRTKIIHATNIHHVVGNQ